MYRLRPRGSRRRQLPSNPMASCGTVPNDAKKKGAFRRPSISCLPMKRGGRGSSALGELEAAARPGATIFLALDDAAVARQEAALLHSAAQIRLVLGERLGDAVAHRAGLARQPAARDGGDHVELLAALRDVERLLDDHLLGRAREIDLLVAAVDGDLAGARLDPDAGDGVLAPARGIGAALGVDFLLAMGGGDLRAGSARGRSGLLQFGKG